MSCYHPIYALKLGVNPDTGKSILKFQRHLDDSYLTLCEKYGKDNIIKLPCGSCVGCKLDYSRTWAQRCTLEASLYSSNYFVTLTYDNAHLPKHLVKRDFQLFMKRLRKVYPGVRYFACGEYGSKTKRPHYHAILFNLDLPDIVSLGKGKYEGCYLTSKSLSSIWDKGFALLGDVSFASCAYTARYCVKKLFQDEFVLMSRRPGIGYKYFEKHIHDIYDTDKVYFNFGSTKVAKPSKYFDKLLGLVDSSMLEAIKNERVSNANTRVASEMLDHGLEYVELLDYYKENIQKDKLTKLKRSSF